MYYVYIILCNDKRLYIGYSQDVQNRLRQHKAGRVRSTRHRMPFSIVCIECYKDKKDTKAREVYLKSGGGHQQIKKQHRNRLLQLGYRHF